MNMGFIDASVPVCPECHTHPRAIENIFDITKMRKVLSGNNKGRPPSGDNAVREKYCYYTCSCGACTTDWYGELPDWNGRKILPPRERARTAYVCGNWIGTVNEFAKHGIDISVIGKSNNETEGGPEDETA